MQIDEQSNGDMHISFNGETLVDLVPEDTEVAEFDYDGELLLSVDGGDFEQIDREDIHGKIKGMFEAKEAVEHYHQELETYATEFTQTLNQQHNNGLDIYSNPGVDLFNGTDSIESLEVNEDIIDDLNLIAAADQNSVDADGEVYAGCGENALAMAEIRHDDGAMEHDGVEVTFDQFYRAVIADLGIETNEAREITDNQKKSGF